MDPCPSTINSEAESNGRQLLLKKASTGSSLHLFISAQKEFEHDSSKLRDPPRQPRPTHYSSLPLLHRPFAMRVLILPLLVSIDILAVADGFATASSPTLSFFVEPRTLPSPRSRKTTALPATKRSSRDNGENEFDIDQVRQQLEALVVGTSDAMARQESPKAKANAMLREKQWLMEEDPIDFDLDLPSQPPLTSIDRERRLAEVHLLRNLHAGDEGLSDLWTHWASERGPAAAARLLKAEELTAEGPRSWGEAERVLRGLIQDYGVYWAEPVNRLATLYYMQGKLRESETLSKIVLKIKPWHFSALSGITMVYAGLRDSESARMWAARRMPSFATDGANKRRAAWVERAVQEAMNSLDAGEKRLTQSFGKQDEHEEFRAVSQAYDDAWQ